MPVATEAATLPPMDHAARRARLRALLEAAGCEALLVTAPTDVRYLSGFSGSNGAIIVRLDAQDDLLVTDARYRERVHDLDVPQVSIERRLEAVLSALGAVPLGVDAEHVTLAQARRFEAARDGAALIATSGLVAGLRVTKDAGEIARLRRACAITRDVLAAIGADGVPAGRSEREIARDVERGFLDRGADGVAFLTIVAAGLSGASPHHEAGDHVPLPGELVTIDCGAEVDGYRADMTRTFAVEGRRVSEQIQEVHAVVEAANAAGRAAARVDGAVSEVDLAARAVVTDAGYGEAFVHPTGHGIGLAVHEAPLVHQGSADSLRSGTTFTVEPGIYLPGVGGVRIEDSLVVLGDAVDVMTDLGRGLAPA